MEDPVRQNSEKNRASTETKTLPSVHFFFLTITYSRNFSKGMSGWYRIDTGTDKKYNT